MVERIPMCNDCWDNLDRGTPHRVLGGPEEVCGICGFPTHSGIYVRIASDTDE